MKERNITKLVQGRSAVDGAGVRLVRVLGNDTVRDFDPFLMLDSFDSTNPSDYLAGFPTHPHRGIETVTYLISGHIDHQDSLGNSGTILSGEAQWMTAGSGILHQEMPKTSQRMLGLQLWLNLSQKEKMCHPSYLSITREDIPLVKRNEAEVRVLSGAFEGIKGITPHHIPAVIYDISLPSGKELTLSTPSEDTAFVFLIEGEGIISGQSIPSKSAVLFSQGDSVTVSAPAYAPLRYLFFCATPLHEPVAWGGPIVMNTKAELEEAFSDLNRGTFIQYTPQR